MGFSSPGRIVHWCLGAGASLCKFGEGRTHPYLTPKARGETTGLEREGR